MIRYLYLVLYQIYKSIDYKTYRFIFHSVLLQCDALLYCSEHILLGKSRYHPAKQYDFDFKLDTQDKEKQNRKSLYIL